MRIISSLGLLPAVLALLPPGYEDELYCPPEFCKMRKTRVDEPVDMNPESGEVVTVLPKGFVGPSSMFHYCAREPAEVGGTETEVEVVGEGEGGGEGEGEGTKGADQSTGPDAVQVTPWGSKFGEEVKAHLLEQGFHTRECPGQAEDGYPDGGHQEGEGVGEDGGPPQPQRQAQEEWSAGPQHWAAIIGIGIAVWWFKSGGSGGNEGGTVGGGKPTAQRPDAEEMRKRRLEALGRASSSIPATSTSADSDSASEGLRQRGSTTGANANASSASPAAPESKTVSSPAASVAATPAPQAAPVVAKKPAPSPAPAAAPVPAAVLETAAVPTAVAAPAKPPAAIAEPFSVTVRGTIMGVVTVHSIKELRYISTVEELREKVRNAFLSGDQANADVQFRLFFSGKELKIYDATLRQLGLAANASIQAMFTAGAGAASAAVASTPAPVIPAAPSASVPQALSGEDDPDDGSSHFTLRAQGTLQGNQGAHVIEGLRGVLTVLDLERRIAAAFDTGEDFRLRLFYMGKELNDGNKRLVEIKFKAGVTVQVMFSPGRPRHLGAADAGAAPGPVVGLAQPLPGDAMTNEAVMAAAAAAGCNPNALLGGGGAPLVTPANVSPEEAWRALGALQEQLARATDMSEEAQVRQASLVLKNMLTTISNEQNPAMMSMAQAMVPDLNKIWSFTPTREYLCAMLNGTPSSAQLPDSASGSASASASS